MARSDAFFAKSGRRPDILTISDQFFDENSVDFFERLLDDRRSLDDAFVVPARMHDIEKTLKNLDRAHKIRVRRRFVDPRSIRHGLQTRSKNQRQIRTEERSKNETKIEARDPPKSTSRASRGQSSDPKSSPGGPVRATKRAIVARSSSIFF